jgi:hypothetical protein
MPPFKISENPSRVVGPVSSVIPKCHTTTPFLAISVVIKPDCSRLSVPLPNR